MSIWDQWLANPLYAQLIKDPGYLQATPAFQKKIHDIFYNYGIQPDAQQQADYGVGPIENNPYSVVSLLARNRDTAMHGSINQANAAGLEESGAAVGALNANNEAYKRNYAGAISQAGNDVGTALGGYASTVNDIYGRLMANPAVTSPIVPQAPLTNTDPGFVTPQGPYQRTGPETPGGVAGKLLTPKPKAPAPRGGRATAIKGYSGRAL